MKQTYTSFFTKLFPIAVITAILLSVLSCTSLNRPYQGPFYRADLITNDLLVEIRESSAKIRIIYPLEAKNREYKNLIDRFLATKVVEYKLFSETMKTSDFKQVTGPQSDEIFYLSVYSYTLLDQRDTISFSIEVRYRTNIVPSTTTWYTLNINKKDSTIIEDETLFSNPIAANNAIIEYVFQDILRQRDEQRLPKINQTINSDIDSNVGYTPLSFSFLPSEKRRNKYIGLRVYISQFNTPENNNRSYAVNVPYEVIRPYLRLINRRLFIEESVPFVTRDLDTLRKFVYPDLEDIF